MNLAAIHPFAPKPACGGVHRSSKLEEVAQRECHEENEQCTKHRLSERQELETCSRHRNAGRGTVLY